MTSGFAIPMFGRIDNFWILLALIIATTIWEWLKKKGQSQQTGSSNDESESPCSPASPRRVTPPPPSLAPRPVRTSGWEEELRRLLTGEAPPPKQAPVAPPPIQPVILPQPQPAPGPVIGRAATLKSAPPPMAGPRISAAEKVVDVQLSQLTESMTAYRRASHLHEEVAEHLKRVEDMSERHLAKVPTAHRQMVSVEAA